MAIIGIDIGGTNFRIGMVDETGCVCNFRKVPVTAVFSTEDPLADLAAYLREYCSGAAAEAVAIGFPATLDANRTTVLQAPNVAFMENLPVVEVLSRELGIPVFIERDVTFALIYDCEKYGIGNSGIVCGFYFGTGIGNAISIDGKPLVGKHGTAGELGHIPVDGSETLCGCGNTGCMEPLAGGRYLKHLCKTLYRDTPLEELFARHAQQAPLQQFIDRMAMAVATEINLMDPHHVLIGGGVPAMKGFPKDTLNQRIWVRTRKPLPAQDLSILYSEDDPEKCVIGAALYARAKL